jgi:hypothetical protein
MMVSEKAISRTDQFRRPSDSPRPTDGQAKGHTVELNRNQYFFLGVVILLIGLQFRVVSSYILTDDATRFLAERSNRSEMSATLVSFTGDMGALPNKVINPPEWLGWCLMSVGSVLILHSLAMKKPGG